MPSSGLATVTSLAEFVRALPLVAEPRLSNGEWPPIRGADDRVHDRVHDQWMTRRNTPANHPRERDDPAPGILRVTAHSTPSPVSAGRGSPLRGRLRVPGDKSISHRALILGLPRHRRDPRRGAARGRRRAAHGRRACRALGARRRAARRPGSWRVHGRRHRRSRRAGGPSRFRQCRHRRAAHDGRRRRPSDHRHLRRRCLAAQAPDAAHPRPARADGRRSS